MNVEYVIGDLLEGDDEVIAHGCNCLKTMAAGIARLIKKKYPGAFLSDQELNKSASDRLGNFSVYHEKGKIVVNLYTQFSPGKDFEYWAFFKSFQLLLAAITDSGRIRKFNDGTTVIDRHPMAEDCKKKTLGIPWIGCGLGGGDKEKVKTIIELLAGWYPEVQITVYSLN